MIDVLSECDRGNEVAGRQGVSRIDFRPFAAVRDSSPSLSDSASSLSTVLSAAFFGLPSFADSADAMSLKMSLAGSVSRDALVESCVKPL